MNLRSIFEWIDAKDIANLSIFKSTKRYLSDVEVIVLKGAWDGKTYEDMATLYGYSVDYLNKDVGNKLWKKLSHALNERITKRNFKEALRRAWEKARETDKDRVRKKDNNDFNHSSDPDLLSINALSDRSTDVSFPEGWEALNSPFYLERSGIEQKCYDAILKPGALIRIKAPKLMGKTSLLQRILNYSTQHQCQTVALELDSCDRAILSDLDKFLRWLCLMVSRPLKLDNRLKEYWDTEILGSNDNCTAYFEDYLLPAIDAPLVLAFDDSDRLFPHTHIVEDVLGLLRSWHEKGKVSSIWQNLRLIIVHSTEVYIPLDIHQSPFNAGLPIELQELEANQIATLAHRHGLTLSPLDIETLIASIGGHPYLIRLALYTLCTKNLSLETLINQASTEAGIYSNHLRRHLDTLHQSPDLIPGLKQVVTAHTPVELSSMQTYKLHSMGLVQRIDNHVIPRCNLYRDYFRRVL